MKLPQIHLIKSVSQEMGAVIETKKPHNYQSGQKIIVNIPREYGYTIRKATVIKVLDSERFKTDLDTSIFPTFVPIKPQPRKSYTPAQCMPCLESEV